MMNAHELRRALARDTPAFTERPDPVDAWARESAAIVNSGRCLCTEDEACADHEALEALANAAVRFWTCKQHLRGRVEWRGDVAHCLEAGCGRTSAHFRSAGDDELPPDEAARWLRGATSAGDPTAWAVRIVLAEYDRRGAIEKRAREVRDTWPAHTRHTALHILGET